MADVFLEISISWWTLKIRKRVKHPTLIPIITSSVSTTNSFVGDVSIMGTFDHFLNSFFFQKTFILHYKLGWGRVLSISFLSSLNTAQQTLFHIKEILSGSTSEFLTSYIFHSPKWVPLQNHCRNKASGLWQLLLYPLKWDSAFKWRFCL